MATCCCCLHTKFDESLTCRIGVSSPVNYCHLRLATKQILCYCSLLSSRPTTWHLLEMTSRFPVFPTTKQRLSNAPTSDFHSSVTIAQHKALLLLIKFYHLPSTYSSTHTFLDTALILIFTTTHLDYKRHLTYQMDSTEIHSQPRQSGGKRIPSGIQQVWLDVSQHSKRGWP